MVFAPLLICLDETLAEALTPYIENGGILSADGKFVEMGPTGIIWEACPGGPMIGLLGYSMRRWRRAYQTPSVPAGDGTLTTGGALSMALVSK